LLTSLLSGLSPNVCWTKASIEYGWTASVESVDAAFAQGLTMTIGLPSPSDLGGVT